MLDTDYDRSGNSNFSFHVEADILNLLILHEYFIFFHMHYLLLLVQELLLILEALV